jgi:hypothetical protein
VNPRATGAAAAAGGQEDALLRLSRAIEAVQGDLNDRAHVPKDLSCSWVANARNAVRQKRDDDSLAVIQNQDAGRRRIGRMTISLPDSE